MNDPYSGLAELLIDVECAMRNMDLWNSERPSDAALASEQPFCIDTLNFSQWLQFIFIERMRILIDMRAPLPENCAIAPMAEEYFRGTSQSGAELIAPLRKLDSLITKNAN